jgi:hypothetical protein
MQKILILMILLISSTKIYAGNNYDYLLSIINNELSEVSRLNKQINASDDNLLLRMAELYLERGRVKKESENEKYLAVPPKSRRKLNKKNFFKGSKADMQKANKIGVYILKKFKNTKVKGDVFYIFAFYAQEFKSLGKAKKYFGLAKKNSLKGSSSFKKSSLALGDIFYNEKKFESAIDNYENAIDDKGSKWWTRDAYNLAWCYFREGKRSDGINLMKDVYRLSQKGFYLNFKKEAQRDLIFFFVDSNRIKDAERFIKKNGEDPKELVKLGKNLIDQGKASKAIYFLQKARKRMGSEIELAEVNNILLDLYEKFGNISAHLMICEEQHKLFLSQQLDETLIKSLEFHLKKITSSIQSKIKSQRYQDQKKVERELAMQHQGYVKIIHDVMKKKSSSYNFFQAEIDYAIGKYEKSAKNYLNVLRDKKRRIKKVTILSSLLACLGKIDVTSEFYTKNAQFIYESYISHEKNLSKKKKIYPLLFSLYLKNNLVPNAEKVLSGYNRAFKNDMKTIESMLATLLEVSEIKNNKKRFLGYVKKINSKVFIISNKLASAIKNNALTLQFKGVQKESSDGQKANALRGYKLIFIDKLSSLEARKNAAFNIAVLFYELKYPKKTAQWLIEAISLMNKSDVKKLFNQLRKISLDLFNQGNEADSLKIMLKIGNLMCEDSAQFRSLSVDYFNLYLISGNAPRLSTAKFLKCVKKKHFYDELKVNSFDYLYIAGDYDYLYKNILMTLSNKKFHSEKEIEISKLLAMHFHKKAPAKSRKIISRVKSKYSKKFQNNIFYKELVALKRYFSYRNESKKIFKNALVFPEKRFNSRLKKRIESLSALSQKIITDPSKGGVLLIAPMYELLLSSYKRLIDEITNFTPKNKSTDYLKVFKKSMLGLRANLYNQKTELSKNLSQLIVSKNILTISENYISSDIPIDKLKKIDLKYWIISDRGN